MERLNNDLFKSNRLSKESMKKLLGGLMAPETWTCCKSNTSDAPTGCSDYREVHTDDNGKVTSDTTVVTGCD